MVKPRIQREHFLRLDGICTSRGNADEEQVPAMDLHGAGHQDELVSAKQIVSKCLLARSRNARPKPVWVPNSRRVHDVDGGKINNNHRRQHVWHRVERFEALMNRNLQDRSRRIDRAVNRRDAPAIPASA